MRINKDSLSARVLNIAKEKGISANVVYSRYFLICGTHHCYTIKKQFFYSSIIHFIFI